MMVGASISPGPVAGNVQYGEFVTGVQIGHDIRIFGRPSADGAGRFPGGADHRPGIMRREELAGEGDVGDVAAVGVNALV